MGWDPCEIRFKANMVGLWNRLLSLPADRVASNIYWDLATGGVWASEMSDILGDCGLSVNYSQRFTVDIQDVKLQLRMTYFQSWSQEIYRKPKLRPYVMFKNEFKCEKYVSFNLPKSQRSLCAQLRGGILPLNIETGRFRGLAEEERICEHCDLEVVEDENTLSTLLPALP